MAKEQQPRTDMTSLVSDFLSFLNASPTAFHAVGKWSITHFLLGENNRWSMMNQLWVYRLFSFWHDCFDLSNYFADESKRRLRIAGYEQVSERDDWKLEAGKKYFFTRNYSTIVAFAIGKKYDFFWDFANSTSVKALIFASKALIFGFFLIRYVAGNGFHIIGAHTDSPCLKLKPVSKVNIFIRIFRFLKSPDWIFGWLLIR